MEPPFAFTNTYWSLPIVIALVVIPLLISLSVAYYILSILGTISIATGWAANYLQTLQGIIGSFDIFILFAFGIMFAAMVIRSYRLQTHPVLGIVGILGIPVAVIATGYAANIVAIFSGIPLFGEALNQFQYTILFLKNSPTVVAAASVLILLVMMGGGLLARR